MTSAQQAAIDKLNAESYKSVNRDREFVFPFVKDILIFFVTESEQFAEFVNANEKTLKSCVDSLTLVGKRTSDLDLYKESVRYFCPGAVVECKMTVRVPNEVRRAKILEFRLEDFL